MENHFKTRTYGFNELAILYFPHVSKASATRMLSLWINKCPKLMQKLIDSDWKKRSKYLTPKQVNIIITHFDTPL